MKYINVLLAEIKLDLEQSWSYKTNFISECIMLCVLYIGLIFMNSGNSLEYYYASPGDSKELILVGYILWHFSIMAINIVSSNLYGEASHGTLSQKFTSIFPMHLLMFGQFLSSIFIQFIEVIVILIVSILIFKVNISINISFLLVLFITLIGMYGIGLIFGGLTLKIKKIGKVIFIIQIILLFVSNIIGGLGSNIYITKLIPLTFGTDIVRKNMTGQAVNINEYLIFSLISLAWLFIGVLVFRYFEKLSKIEGLIDSY